MRIGTLTGGGDCPGLDPAIRALVLRALAFGDEVWGFRNGWKGLIDGDAMPLGVEDVEGIIGQGGTMLGTSRTNPFKKGRESDLRKTLDNIKKYRLDALVAIGGDDTLGVANKLFRQGIPTVGVPKTMDNDLSETDFTFGFDSAVSVATQCVDRLRDTARSHSRVLVVEVMGRDAGWVALYTGIAGGADWILIPEVGLNIEEMCAHLIAQRARGKNYGIVVASEGVKLPRAKKEVQELDDFGHPIHRGVGTYIATQIQQRTAIETRFAVLGHIQRGGPPTEFDRVLASRLAIKAAEMVHAGEFGKMSSIKGNRIVSVDIEKAVGRSKRVPLRFYNEAKVLFSK